MNHKLFALAALSAAVPVFAQYPAYSKDGQDSGTSNATGPYEKTQIQAQLRLNLDKDVEKVHFLRDNNDPNVVTKAYVLKHADPYEIRPFIQNAVNSRRIKESPTHVECIKYSDGTGILLVSAEDYRFTGEAGGIGMDELVAKLDKPKLTSSSGSLTYVYFPKYFSAEALTQLIRQVGANVEGDNVELQYGRDSLRWDTALNAMFLYIPRYSEKQIAKLIELYDIPAYDVKVSYQLYEIDAENDTKIGLDFQAWKNNEGADFFSVGGRFRDGWSASWAGGANHTVSSNTRFLNFNPKWNTRYLDFLVSRGKASVATRGEVRIATTSTGTVTARTQLFNFENGDPVAANTGFEAYAKIDDLSTWITAVDSHRKTLTLAAVPGTVVKMSGAGTPFYTIRSDSEVYEGQKELTVASVSINSYTDPSGAEVPYATWNTDGNYLARKGYKINTSVSSYGFTLSMTPTVSEKSTVMTIDVKNDSLIGWKSDGTPRISRDTGLNTTVMLGNDGQEFVIGGLSKRSAVSSDGGIPWLKKIPLLGYLFSTEGQATKRSSLVLVLRCSVVDTVKDKVDGTVGTELQSANAALSGAGTSVPYANTQWGMK